MATTTTTSGERADRRGGKMEALWNWLEEGPNSGYFIMAGMILAWGAVQATMYPPTYWKDSLFGQWFGYGITTVFCASILSGLLTICGASLECRMLRKCAVFLFFVSIMAHSANFATMVIYLYLTGDQYQI